MSEIEDLIDNDDFLEVLKDGDNRPKPSTVIQYVPLSKSPSVLKHRTDDEVKDEVENNLREIIDFGQNAIKDLSDLASQSEHPRPYEALSALMKSVADTNLALANMRKKDKIDTSRFQESENKDGTYKASVSDILDEIAKNDQKED